MDWARAAEEEVAEDAGEHAEDEARMKKRWWRERCCYRTLARSIICVFSWESKTNPAGSAQNTIFRTKNVSGGGRRGTTPGNCCLREIRMVVSENAIFVEKNKC